MKEFKLDYTPTHVTARSGKVGIAKAGKVVHENDPMLNQGAPDFVSCQKCGTSKRSYYANIEGILTCGHCIYLKSKKNNSTT